MTNLEWLAKNGRDYLFDCYFCECAHVAKFRTHCNLECQYCEFRSDADVVKALMEEREEKNNEQV